MQYDQKQTKKNATVEQTHDNVIVLFVCSIVIYVNNNKRRQSSALKFLTTLLKLLTLLEGAQLYVIPDRHYLRKGITAIPHQRAKRDFRPRRRRGNEQDGESEKSSTKLQAVDIGLALRTDRDVISSHLALGKVNFPLRRSPKRSSTW